MQPQLLDLFATSLTFGNFIALGNEQVTTALQSQSSQFSHLTGSKQSGKTHLLQAWTSLAHTQGRTAVYLDSCYCIHDIRTLADKFSFIALDNIEYFNEEQQIALFDLFNAIKLNNRENFLLTSSNINLHSLSNMRNDLKTRILSGLNLKLISLDDEKLLQVLAIFIAAEGISLDYNVQNYLINHHTRNIGILIQTIRQLAEIAILEKRHITIPLIKQVFGSTA